MKCGTILKNVLCKEEPSSDGVEVWMSDNSDIVDSIATKTVTEERQNIVSKRVTNRFAIFGMAVGALIAVFGVLTGTGVFEKLGLSLDERIGYIMLAAGIFMFCYFGMNVRQNEISVENYTVEKQVPYEMSPYLENKLREREEMIDTKVNAMSAAFEKLALLTSELEEKIIAAEKLKLEDGPDSENDAKKEERLTRAAASAVITAIREEKRAEEEAETRRRYEETVRKNEELDKKSELLEKKNMILTQKENELKSIKDRLSAIEEGQKEARERLRLEEDRFRTESEEKEQQIKEEKLALAIEKEALLVKTEELEKKIEELNAEKEKVNAVLKAEEERKAREEARLSEEAERKTREQKKFSDLGLSAMNFAWSSEMKKTEE